MGAYRRRVILVLGGLRVVDFVYIDRGQKKYIACSSKSYPLFYFGGEVRSLELSWPLCPRGSSGFAL